MCVAPEASLDDGALDVIVISGLSRAGLLARLAKIYSGAHLRDPAVRVFRGCEVEFLTSDGRVPLEVDGEAIGRAPLRAVGLEAALKVRVGPDYRP